MGLVDIIQLQLIPVLLGGGARLSGAALHCHVELERTMRTGTPAVTHLRHRVGR